MPEVWTSSRAGKVTILEGERTSFRHSLYLENLLVRPHLEQQNKEKEVSHSLTKDIVPLLIGVSLHQQ